MRLLAGYVVHQGSTLKHKLWVALYMARLYPHVKAFVTGRDWARRALIHDWTKWKWDEAEGFARTIFDLNSTTYNTPEYRALLQAIAPSLDLHYQRWDHHPEHQLPVLRSELGDYLEDSQEVRDYVRSGEALATMPVAAKLEMACDWAAASRRHADGSYFKSVDDNKTRFGYGPKTAAWLKMLGERMGAR